MSTTIKVSKIGVSLGIGIITLFAITYGYIKRKRKSLSTNEQAWQHIGDLKEITLYPIKSSSAVITDEAQCGHFGLSIQGIKDRCLIVINENDDKIVSCGSFPRMLSIKIKVDGEGILSLSTANETTTTLIINLNELQAQNKTKRVKKMRGFTLKLTECNEEHHKWISQVILNKENGMRLYMTDDPIIETSWWRNIEHDIMPIMVMHDKSVEKLNSKINFKSLAHHLQFRGNFLIHSLPNIAPFDEDKWMWLKIGDNPETCTILRYNSPCLRCIIPNIDIHTCERNTDFEPLRTLRKFRLRSHSKDPEMGVYFDVFKTGAIKCGDAVYVQYK